MAGMASDNSQKPAPDTKSGTWKCDVYCEYPFNFALVNQLISIAEDHGGWLDYIDVPQANSFMKAAELTFEFANEELAAAGWAALSQVESCRAHHPTPYT
jgi:hypothetical protein